MLEFVTFRVCYMCGLIALFVSSSLKTPLIAAMLVCKDETTISMVVSEKRSSKGV